jgi:hypothetical protein
VVVGGKPLGRAVRNVGIDEDQKRYPALRGLLNRFVVKIENVALKMGFGFDFSAKIVDSPGTLAALGLDANPVARCPVGGNELWMLAFRRIVVDPLDVETRAGKNSSDQDLVAGSLKTVEVFQPFDQGLGQLVKQL